MDGETLKSRLPHVRGRLEANYPLADLTWFRVGGPAEVLYTPADEADLAAFMAGLPEDIPFYVIGVGSNLLVRDGGLPGVVIRLGRGFAEVTLSWTHAGSCGDSSPGCSRCPLCCGTWYRWINLSERYTGQHRRRASDEWRCLWR